MLERGLAINKTGNGSREGTGRIKRRCREDQENVKRWSIDKFKRRSSRGRDTSRGERQKVKAQEKDKRRTREGQEKDKRRTREGPAKIER